MYEKQRMRPTNRPKLERRTQNTRPRPQANYSNRKPKKRKPAQTFQIPQDRLELVPKWKLALGALAFVIVMFTVSYVFGWSIGHFMKGWW